MRGRPALARASAIPSANHLDARLPEQFDAVLRFDEAFVVEPLMAGVLPARQLGATSRNPEGEQMSESDRVGEGGQRPVERVDEPPQAE